MAKRRVGRPRVKGGPRKLTGKSVKSYMSRGLASALKKGGKKRGTFGKKRRMGGGKGRGAPGKPKSAAHRKAIAAGVRAAHKRGAYKNVKRRRKTRGRRKAA